MEAPQVASALVLEPSHIIPFSGPRVLPWNPLKKAILLSSKIPENAIENLKIMDFAQ